jgi:hypothetical protein
MEVPILPSGVYVNGPLRSCGMDVLISTGPYRSPRKATVGGIVCVDNDYYGLTCVHAFSEAKTPDAGEDRDLEFAFYGLNDDHGLGVSDDEDDSIEMTSQGDRGRSQPIFLGLMTIREHLFALEPITNHK